MDKNLNIIKTKSNDISFELEIEGVDANDEKVNFVIESKDLDFSIPCKKSDGKNWTVTIPEMEQLDATLYKFHISVVTSGYYFQPFTGTLNVVKSAELYVKNVENKTTKSTVDASKPESKKSSPKPDTKVENGIDVDKLAKEIKKEVTKKTKAPKTKTTTTPKSEIKKIADEITKKVTKVETPTKKKNYKVSKIDETVLDIIRGDSNETTTKVKFKKGDIKEI